MLGRIFTDYYKAQKLTAAKSRFDVTHKQGSYPLFEKLLLNKTKFNVGGLSFNYGKYSYSEVNAKREHQMCISRRTHISGVYVYDLQNSLTAYGDIKGTNDAIILIFSEDYKTIEIFIARGKANDSIYLYNKVRAGRFSVEMKALQIEAREVFKKPLELFQ